jgi:hypothetical protein
MIEESFSKVIMADRTNIFHLIRTQSEGCDPFELRSHRQSNTHDSTRIGF